MGNFLGFGNFLHAMDGLDFQYVLFIAVVTIYWMHGTSLLATVYVNEYPLMNFLVLCRIFSNFEEGLRKPSSS